MELIFFAVLFVFAGALGFSGFYLEPVNPFLILTSSMFLFLVAASLIAGGLEIPNGETVVDLNLTTNKTVGTLTDTMEPPHRFISTPLNLIILLLSLYLAYFSIDMIISSKYGEANVK
jgi:hypothetical protein|tara:strand:- start:1909 stop:2262 length:354 start_codon:yes stop_codon:yes gene_type:complete